MATLQDLLTSTNPYAEQYLHMQEVLAEAERKAAAADTVMPVHSLTFSNPRDADPRRYTKLLDERPQRAFAVLRVASGCVGLWLDLAALVDPGDLGWLDLAA